MKEASGRWAQPELGGERSEGEGKALPEELLELEHSDRPLYDMQKYRAMMKIIDRELIMLKKMQAKFARLLREQRP